MGIIYASLCLFIKFVGENSGLMFNFIKGYEYVNVPKKVINSEERR